MIDNLIFSLNATVPVFTMMLLGMLFRKLGWMSESFASQCNRFVFQTALPAMLFRDLVAISFDEVWDPGYIVFCFLVTALCIAAAMGLSLLLTPGDRGEFIQAGYRSSAALLGGALINNLYGGSPMTSLMIIGSVPLYNIMAVVVLSLMKPEPQTLDRALIRKTVKGILLNPIILGIVVGVLWSLIRIPYPPILSKVVNNLACLASPLGLMAMGATFDYRKAIGKIGPSLLASFLKLVGFAALFLPMAAMLGYRDDALMAILIMLGSSATPAGYVMARSMGHDGTISSSTVMLTTVLCGFTLTFWIYVLRSFGLLA